MGGGKNFETVVYSYNKFIKKTNIWIHLQVVRDKKKKRELNMVVYFFFFSKTQFLDFVDCVNMTYFLRGSDLLWAYSSFLCQVLPTLSSCGFSSFVPLPSFLLPTKWKQWLSKYTPPKTATILSLVTQLLRPLFSMNS